MFIDHTKIYVKAGSGGNGCISFRREKYVPKGGPDGGDGGNGGNVVIAGSHDVSTLIDLHYQQRYVAESGEDGSGQKCSGKNGADRIIPVPMGTLIRDSTTEEILGDLTQDAAVQIVAAGGRGGRGNSHFKSSTRQTPYIAEAGKKGEERWLSLELKLLADVGLVGLPNAGKSTLISVLSNAKPKIADYPFTTLIPHLGVVQWGRHKERPFTLADIPGLIEGASLGKGLGVQFLRHIERTTLLLHLVDVSDGAADPVRALLTVRSELSDFDPKLAEKPFMVAATKIDALGQQVVKLRRYCKTKKIPCYEISAVTGAGIPPLLWALGKQVDENRSARGHG